MTQSWVDFTHMLMMMPSSVGTGAGTASCDAGLVWLEALHLHIALCNRPARRLVQAEAIEDLELAAEVQAQKALPSRVMFQPLALTHYWVAVSKSQKLKRHHTATVERRHLWLHQRRSRNVWASTDL